MKDRNNIYKKTIYFLVLVFITVVSCERDLSDDAVPSSRTTNGEIFTDAPIGLGTDFYFPYAPDANNPIGSKLDAWSLDNEVSYLGTTSMRFDVPNSDDPNGNYAGAIFRTEGENSGRDLSGYDALTFYAKASQAATIAGIGFGEDFGENKYMVTRENINLSTNWVKYIIPIPNPSKLTNERGMLRYAAASVDGFGYSFWLDEVKFEKLGTIAHGKAIIYDGNDQETTSFTKVVLNVASATQVLFNLPNTVNQILSIAPAYLDFSSSDSSVASVNELGLVTVNSEGVAVISAEFAGASVEGSLTINSLGDFPLAPIPTRDASQVISIYSDTYNDVPVDFYNGYWEPFQTTVDEDFSIDGNNMLSYFNFNFVGNQFRNPTIDITEKPNLHIDMYIPDEVPSNLDFLISIVNYGAADSRYQKFFKASDFVANTWVTLEFPIILAEKDNVGLIIYENVNGSSLTKFYLDNIYFY